MLCTFEKRNGTYMCCLGFFSSIKQEAVANDFPSIASFLLDHGADSEYKVTTPSGVASKYASFSRFFF